MHFRQKCARARKKRVTPRHACLSLAALLGLVLLGQLQQRVQLLGGHAQRIVRKLVRCAVCRTTYGKNVSWRE
jgi:hypothetical protein